LRTAEQASSLKPEAVPELLKALRDRDSAVRYWAAMGLLMRGADAVKPAETQLRSLLADPAPSVRIVACEALGRYGTDDDVAKVLPVLMELASPEKNGIYLSLLSLNALDAMGAKARPVKEAVKSLPSKDPSADARLSGYAANLIASILQN
jgi:uncharacterized sulfatase